MNLKILNQNFYKKSIVILKNTNPFKKKSLQYYLINFVIKHEKEINQNLSEKITWYTKNNNKLINFLSNQKEKFYIDAWNANGLFEQALSLCFIHNIIKLDDHKDNKKKFGLFAEDGLFDVLSEKSFTNNLPKGKISYNTKLLWLSLYMNHEIREQYVVPTVKLENKNNSIYYHQQNFSIEFKNFAYNNLSTTCVKLRPLGRRYKQDKRF